MYDPHYLLRGIQRAQHALADRLVADAGHEVARDGIADVSFQKGLLNRTQALAHVRFGKLPLAAERAECGRQTFLNRFEHEREWAIRRRAWFARILTALDAPQRRKPEL